MALSWLQTYSRDDALVGQYDMKIVNRGREKHTNADSLSRKTEFYCVREQREQSQRSVLLFLDQGKNVALPMVPWIDKNCYVDENRPEYPITPQVQVHMWRNNDGSGDIEIFMRKEQEVIPKIPELAEDEDIRNA